MDAYSDVVVVIKMGAYIHGVLILCGCLLSRLYSIYAIVHAVHQRSSTVQEGHKRRQTQFAVIELAST